MTLQLSHKGKQRTLIQNNDPTESLRVALRKFQDALTTEQQQHFKDSTSRPDAADVLVFAAKLDAENNSKTRRSVAPRLCTFLNAIQQFTGAVDAFVSSKPEIAALIWGGVKTAITVASNVFSYFDKVTDMIMEIGIDCPTFQEFGHLYPGCVGLQKALCGYYAVIVEVCIKVIQVSGRSFGVQAISSLWNPFESEFKPLIDSLKPAKRQVKSQTEVALAHVAQETKRILDDENQKNAFFRPSALSFLRKSENHQEETKQWQINQARREIASLKTKIRQNLSSIDHMSPWKRCLKQKVDLTAEWLVEEPIFLEWKSSPNTALFWCSGTMGTGKTVLMSNVVSYLHRSRKDNEIISHFFCSSENENSLAARSIVGSITRQLLEIVIERSEHEDLLSMQNDTQDLDTGEALEFLISSLPPDKTYFVVLDGLDECEPTQIRVIARSLSSICQQTGKMKIICAGRPELKDDLFRWVDPHFHIVIEKEKLDQDIDRYIVTSLDECMEDGRLVLRDSSIIAQITNVLHDGSQGMFLWVKLCISDLCGQNCDEDILDTLEHLPRGLSELLDSKLRRVEKGNDGMQATKLLQFCGVLKRPLTAEEYEELLAISIDDKLLDTRKIPNSMNRIIRGCYGLTFIDDEERTVHFVHQSVKMHLFDVENKRVPKFDRRDVDKHMGLLCMTYLNFSNFSKQVTKTDKSGKSVLEPLQMGTSSVSSHDLRATGLVHKLYPKTERLLGMKFREFEKNALESRDFQARFARPESQSHSFPFLSYAKTHWCLHLKELEAESGSKFWLLFCKCIEDKTLPLDRPWESYVWHSSAGLPFKSADAFQLYMAQHFVLVTCDPVSFIQALSSSLARDFHEVVWTFHQRHFALFQYFLRQIQSSSSSTSTTLTRTLRYNWICFPTFTDGSTHRWVDMLVGVPGLTNFWSQSLYSVAEDSRIPGEKRFNIFLDILRKMKYFDAKGASLALGGALWRAVFVNNLVDFMLAADKAFYPKNSTINQKAETDQTNSFVGNVEILTTPVLHLAVERGNHRTLQELLDAGANVNVRDNYGETALVKAIKIGQTEKMKALVAAGAIFYQHDLNSGILVHAAFLILAETPEIGEVPLSAGVDFDKITDRGITALQMAVMNQGIPASQDQTSVIKAFLDVGADVDARNTSNDTALHMAIVHKQTEVAKTLVAANADVNLRGRFNRTALHIAVIQREKALVELLVAAGADVNARDESNCTALHMAATQGEGEVLKLLVAAHADVNSRDQRSQTALHMAVIQCEDQELRPFCSSDVLFSTNVSSHRIDIDESCRGKRVEMVRVLLDAGAEVDLKTDDGLTAYNLASKLGRDELMRILRPSAEKTT